MSILTEHLDKPFKGLTRHFRIGEATPEILKVFMLSGGDAQRNLVP